MISDGEHTGRGLVTDDRLAARLSDLDAVVPIVRPRKALPAVVAGVPRAECLKRRKDDTPFVGSFIDRAPGEEFPRDSASLAAVPQPAEPFRTELHVVIHRGAGTKKRAKATSLRVTICRFDAFRHHCQHLLARLVRRQRAERRAG